MSNNKLSVIIITHNEEKTLPNCLKSIKNWVDEIIILDYKSKDKTRHIARKFGAYVYYTKKWTGFGIQRQLAQTLATGEYIFSLDADERISISLKNSIMSILKQPINANTVFSCARRNLFLKRWIRYSGWYPDFVIRLYPKKYYYNSLQVHESLKTNNAKVIKMKGELFHLACQYLPHFQKKQLEYAEIWAIENHKKNKKINLLTIILHTIGTFLKTLLINRGFLDGKHGFLLSIIKSQYTFNKYSILWTLKQKKNHKKPY